MNNCVLQIRVTGRVQGVGFRAFVKARADERGIQGWVRNLSDGSVEILSLVSKDLRSPWMETLREGPPGSAVVSLEVRDLTPEEIGPLLEEIREFRIERALE